VSERVTLNLNLTDAGARAIAEQIGDGTLMARCLGSAQQPTWPLSIEDVAKYLRQGWSEVCPICGGPLMIGTAEDQEASP
jgi:hypothetical protein